MFSDSKDAEPGRDAAESLAGDSGSRKLRRGSCDRVIVTGARGFIGRAVVRRLLETGWQVDAVSSSPEARSSEVRWHTLDLLDQKAVETFFGERDPSHLIHLAWAPNRGIVDSPANEDWALAGRTLLEQFARAGGKRALFAGSSAEYDWTSHTCRELESPLAGNGRYGEAKRALAEDFFRICQARDVSGVWARIFFLFGPHEPSSRLVAAVARAALAGDPVEVSSGDQIRDYMYIEDAADALVMLLASDLTGPVNVGSGKGTVLRELIKEVVRVAGGSGPIEWGAKESSPGDARRVVADANRLYEELGWQPPVGLEQGIERTVAWWREQREAESSLSQ